MRARYFLREADRKMTLILLLILLFFQPVEAHGTQVVQSRLIQKMEEVNLFGREHTGYKALTLPKVVFLSADQMETLRYGKGGAAKVSMRRAAGDGDKCLGGA